ncbi:hypothetical protein P7C71_g4375, partial [Lecanoromycetidae sp. Uapishka_2]
MKRKASDSVAVRKAKRQKDPEPDYCDAATQKDSNGETIWPAAREALRDARTFIQDCATSGEKTLIVPDKDADGLDAGVILHKTLITLGLLPDLIDVHLIDKNHSVHDEAERAAMQAKNPKYIIVVDQGSRSAPPIVDSADTKSLIIDHHLSDEFPKNATVVSACHYPPVATSALLTYEICSPLHPDISSSCGFLCAMGTHGDLGNILKWKPPFPDMTEVFKTHTKKAINDAVALINARYVNFSCRIARCARSRDPPVNIIASLKAAADLDTGDLVERLGESFARGHKEASGGIVPVAEFEDLMKLMQIGEKPEPKLDGESAKKKTMEKSPQKNNLMNYFGKKV